MSLEENRRKRTEIEVEATEQAVCTCGWCGAVCESEIKQTEDRVFGNRRMLTSGHASSTAAWDGAKHLEEVGATSNLNDIKKELINSRSYSFNDDHVVTIKPSVSAKSMVKKV